MGVLVTATVAPLLGGPALSAEMVSQLVLGEGAEVLEERGTMLRVRTVLDQYEGWLHQGYVSRRPMTEVLAWVGQAGWSEGALLEDGTGVAIRAPHRARLLLEGEDWVRLPDGDAGRLVTGTIRSYPEVMRDARGEGIAHWAWREFAGTPYLWGGVTAAGIDCSGLVQTTFLARGIPLPRDARDQAAHGTPVPGEAWAVDDLLFFRAADGERITHVAIGDADGEIVHSTVDTARVTREPLPPGLAARLVGVRRFS